MQLWTYNFDIHDYQDKNAVMNVWSENVASRGVSEVASCLLHYVKKLPSAVNQIWLTAEGNNNCI